MRVIRKEADLVVDPRPILFVLRALQLGDLLVAVPALTGLRNLFPNHQLVLATPKWLQDIVALIPSVDALYPTEGLNEWNELPPGVVDIAVNLHGNGQESRAIIDSLKSRLKLVHCSESDPTGAPWLEDVHQRQRWVNLVTHYGGRADSDAVAILVPSVEPLLDRACVLHVGASFGSRKWPEDRFAQVAAALHDRQFDVVITGGPEDRERGLAVAHQAGVSSTRVIAGRADLRSFAVLIAKAKVVVTVDTGAAHLASAYETPSVVIFGPALPKEWGPPPGPHITLTDENAPRGDVFASKPDAALLAVSAEQVISATFDLLSRESVSIHPLSG